MQKPLCGFILMGAKELLETFVDKKSPLRLFNSLSHRYLKGWKNILSKYTLSPCFFFTPFPCLSLNPCSIPALFPQQLQLAAAGSWVLVSKDPCSDAVCPS